MKLARWFLWSGLVMAAGCGGSDTVGTDQTLRVLEGVSPQAWSRLSSEKIYFGHQSVGYEVVKGIEDLVRLEPKLGLKVVETSDAAAFDGPMFAHSKNGENKKPDVKIAAFERAIEGGLGGRVDVAFFKFCYVDITPETDVEKLIASYRDAMSRLRDEFPSTRLIHITSPVTVVESGPKAWAKRILGRPLAGEAANVARNRFNVLLRAEYAGKEPVFDLAEVESTYPDGRKATFDWKGAAYPRLIAGYSYDGRHLNESGRRWVAAHLLRFLAELPAPAASPNVDATQIGDRRGGA